MFVLRFSSTEGLRQLSQQLNGLVAEVPQKLEPSGGWRGKDNMIETEAEVPKRKGRCWEQPAGLGNVFN